MRENGNLGEVKRNFFDAMLQYGAASQNVDRANSLLTKIVVSC